MPRFGHCTWCRRVTHDRRVQLGRDQPPTEQELFKQRKRLADAERTPHPKKVKEASEDRRISTDQVAWYLEKLAALQRTELSTGTRPAAVSLVSLSSDKQPAHCMEQRAHSALGEPRLRMLAAIRTSLSRSGAVARENPRICSASSSSMA